VNATFATLGVDRARGLDRRGLGALTLGHLGADFCQGAVPALLPFLVHERGLSYSAASALVLVMTATSSLLQPLFGHVADRRGLPWMAPAALVVAAGGIALAALATAYPALVAGVALSGLGVGAFHPEAARRAHHAGGERRATGMSLFSVGGNAGFALAPAVVTPLVLTGGIPAAALAAAVPLAAAVALAATIPHLLALPAAVVNRGSAGAGEDRWGPFALVAGVAAARSGVYFALQAFLPAFLIAHLAMGAGESNAALTVLLAAGAVGTLVGGRLADTVGPRPVLVGCLAALPPLLAGFLVAGPAAAFVLAALVGFVCVGNFTVTVVLGQELLPQRLGVASGVTLGAAMGVGGLVAAALRPLADRAGLVAVMVVVALLPLPGLALALALSRARLVPAAR
jgi:FSR family fosmidomycin resistance protein-like MFS transporter